MTKCFFGHDYDTPKKANFDQANLNAPLCPQCYEIWSKDQFFNPGRMYLTSASVVFRKK